MFNKAECILAISKGSSNYCDKWMEAIGVPQGLPESTCKLPIIKANEIHERGLKNELISDAEWQGILQ